MHSLLSISAYLSPSIALKILLLLFFIFFFGGGGGGVAYRADSFLSEFAQVMLRLYQLATINHDWIKNHNFM